MRCEPRIKVIPPGQVKHAGPQITRLARMGGIELDEAQQMLAAATSGADRDGRWCAFESVIFQPRQNGKSEYLLARILSGLYLFGEELIVFSAHRASTTTKVFRRLRLDPARRPLLRAAHPPDRPQHGEPESGNVLHRRLATRPASGPGPPPQARQAQRPGNQGRWSRP